MLSSTSNNDTLEADPAAKCASFVSGSPDLKTSPVNAVEVGVCEVGAFSE